MRRVALAEVKDDLSRLLRLAESEEILITRHGKPAGVLIGFEGEEDWSNGVACDRPWLALPGLAHNRAFARMQPNFAVHRPGARVARSGR